MSAEIVVGACYRDGDDTSSEVIRVTRVSGGLVTWESLPPLTGGETVSEERWRTFNAVRVPDPTPAVIDDAEPPLAGELTARQFFAWTLTQDADRAPRVHISCTGGTWTATLTVCPPGQDRVTQRSASARDPQDALTALMSEER